MEVHPTNLRPLHLLHRSSVLESLILKNSIGFELVVHRSQTQSSVQCNSLYYIQYRILHDLIHWAIRIVPELVLIRYTKILTANLFPSYSCKHPLHLYLYLCILFLFLVVLITYYFLFSFDLLW